MNTFITQNWWGVAFKNFIIYRRVPKVAAPVTFGISRPEGPQLSDGRYFRVAVTFG